jgi:DNA-binding YbaB/EbfC family protein
MARIQADLKEMVVEGAAGGGMVRAHVNGQREILSVKIDPEVIQADDAEMLEDMIVAAVNQGLKKASEMAQKEMGKATGGLDLSGLMG